MKRILQTVVWLGVLGMLASVNVSQAQQRGGFRSQAAEILCDVLVLNPETSEKVVAVYDEVRTKRRQEMRDSGADFQSMSDEERREFFEKYQKNTAADLKKELKGVLSEKELAEIEAILMRRLFLPDAELRALRLIDLKKDQQQKIQPLAIELGKKMVAGGSRFFGAEQSEEEREKAQKAFDEAKASFVTKVAGILSDAQNSAWKEKAKEVNTEIEEIRERMRNFQR
jgi:hypothetical protein